MRRFNELALAWTDWIGRARFPPNSGCVLDGYGSDRIIGAQSIVCLKRRGTVEQKKAGAVGRRARARQREHIQPANSTMLSDGLRFCWGARRSRRFDGGARGARGAGRGRDQDDSNAMISSGSGIAWTDLQIGKLAGLKPRSYARNPHQPCNLIICKPEETNYPSLS